MDRAKADEMEEWWRQYEAHLHSEKWHTIRTRVIARDGGICRGCLVNKATQAHHLTYERMGEEMAFDLVAVCDDCHRKIHPHRFKN